MSIKIWVTIVIEEIKNALNEYPELSLSAFSIMKCEKQLIDSILNQIPPNRQGLQQAVNNSLT